MADEQNPKGLDTKKVIEEINQKFDEFKKVNDAAEADREKRSGETSALNLQKLEEINKDITELRKLQNELEKRSKRQEIGTQNGDITSPEKELQFRAYSKYIRYGMGETSKASWKPEEVRALGGTSDADGQFLVPAGWESELLMNAFNLAAVRPLCQIGTTSRDVVQMGALSKPTVAWGKRSVAVSEQNLSAGGAKINIRNLKALTLISNDTLDDADADIMGELKQAFELAVAEAEDDAFIAGTDEDAPPGIMANTAVLANYVATGVAANIFDGTHNGMDVILDMLYSLNSAYRRNGTFAMNSLTEAAVRQLKNGDGDYMWQPSLQIGNPVALHGRPIVNPEGMDDIAAGAYPILFGDFRSGYKIRDRSGLTIVRLIEKYAEYDQTGLLLKKRVGGQVTLPEAFVPLKVAAS